MQDEQEISMDDFMSEQFDVLDAAETNETTEIEAPAPMDENPDSIAAVETKEDSTDEVENIDEASDAESDDSQAIAAPKSMSNEDREKFYALPPESQAWLADRVKEQETDYTHKTMELAESRKGFDKLEAVIAPRRQQLALDGMDESTAVGQLFALSDYANNDPVGFVQYLFNQRGIPLSAITEKNNGGNEAAVNPQMAAMQRDMNGLKNVYSQQLNAQQAAQSASITTDIEAFKANPDYAFYDELEADMVPMVANFKKSNPNLSNAEYLSKAYKAALAVNDGVSAKVDADKAAKAAAVKIADSKKASAAAKKAGGTNIRSKAPLPASVSKSNDVGEFLGALYDEQMSA